MAGGKKEPIIVAQIMGKMNGGGVEAVIMNYYRHIDRTKVQFDFIVDEDSTNIPREEIEKLGGHVILCPPYQKLRKYMKFLEKLFREKKYRIVHSNINTLSVFPLKAAKKAGVPVRIAHSHNTSNPREIKRNIAKNVLRKLSKKYATDFFACSEVAGRYQFGNKAFNEGKVKIIPNAIDVEKFKYDPVARKKLRKEIGIKDNDFVIGHVGAFRKQKNHSFLIDVFAEVKKERKNAKLVLVGQGPLRQQIEEKVKKLGLEKDVFFLGQRNDVNKLYSVFDVFCLPSLYEGMPVVGIEAQANGVPCVLSDTITSEILITNNSKLVSNVVDDVSKACIITKGDYKRATPSQQVDINECSSRLCEYYLNKNKPTIAFILNNGDYSGAETVNVDIIHSLRHDYNFIYISQAGAISEVLKKNNIASYEIERLNRAELKKAINNVSPDIMHATDYKAGIECALTAKKIPFLIHIHNNSPWIKKICMKSVVFLVACLKAKKILTVSESIGNEYVFAKIIKEKIVCVSNPVNFSKTISKKKDAQNNKVMSDICCVARVVKQKNPERFIEVIEKIARTIPDVRAIWVGDGEMIDACRELVAKKGLGNNLVFSGYSSNPYRFYVGSKIFMLTSDWEGFGLAAYEAICMGKPCVVSRVGGLPSVVDDTCGRLCDKNKIDDFVEELIRLLRDDEYYRRKSLSCVLRAKRIDNSQSYMKNMKRIYDEIGR